MLGRRGARALATALVVGLVAAALPAGEAAYRKSPIDPPQVDIIVGALAWSWDVEGALLLPDGSYREVTPIQVVIEYHCIGTGITCYQLLIEGALATIECSWTDWNNNAGGSLIPTIDPVHTYRMDECGLDFDVLGLGGLCIMDVTARATHGDFDMRGEGSGPGGCTIRDF